MHTLKNILTLFILVLAMASCSSVKKTQHVVNEFSKVLDKEKKDSSQVVKVEEQKGISEQETNTKNIDIVFPDQPDQSAKAEDYFFIDWKDSVFNMVPTVTKVRTNRTAAVTIKKNGDIQLNTAPKSITITENSDKAKVDTSSKTTNTKTDLNTDKQHAVETGKKEVEATSKKNKLLSGWWLLLLLIIPAAWIYNRIKEVKKLTEPIKFI